MNSKSKPLLYDKQIIPRVQECLLENSKKGVPDLGTITRLLQDKYPEYRRRRQGQFRQLVKQAYRIVYVNLNEEFSSSESRTESDTEQTPEPETPKNNVLNSLFQNMYKANISRAINPKAGKSNTDTICISSGSSCSSDEAECGSKTSKSDYSNICNAKVEDIIHKAAAANNISKSAVKRKTGLPMGQQLPQKQRTFKKQIFAVTPKLNFENVAGNDNILKNLCEVLFNVIAPQYYLELGVKPPNGILIYGPTGCGKTTLAESIAGQIEFQFINVPATELIAGISGESEERIREIFEQAILFAPCVLFIDDIDAIATNRAYAQKEMQSRMTSQLINSLDTLKYKSRNARILIIGATSRPEALDPALRRPGRFDHEISIPVPDRKGRYQIIERLCRDLSLEKGFDYDKIAELTPGYVAADIAALVSRAGVLAVKRMWSTNLLEIQNAAIIKRIKLNNENPILHVNNDEKMQQQPTIEAEKAVNGAVNGAVKGDAKESNHEVLHAVEVKGTTEKLNENFEDTKQDKEFSTPPKKKLPHCWEPPLQQLLHWLESPPDDLQICDNIFFTMEDFLEAIKVVQPSAKREGFITVPDITWDDIGALHDVRDQLKLAILAQVKYPKLVERLGLSGPAGVLLCGPPGCGKTLIAKAIANEAGTNFISVKGPEMMNMYVGESERAVRECFQRARNSAPCVIFFDEFDSLCPRRSNTAEGTSGVRIVNQLLTEMDGVEERKGVYVMAATNRPDIIDPAILRPGRLDNIIYIGMPDKNARCEILNAITKHGKNPVMSKDVQFEDIAELTDGYTGADLSGLIRQASQLALKHALKNNVSDEELCVTVDNLKEAISLIRPSISEQERKVYDELRSKYGSKESS